MDNQIKPKVDELLVAAMNAEKEANRFYADASEKAKSQAGKKLFKELADFEQNHYDRLKKIIEDRNKGVNIGEDLPIHEIKVKPEVEGEFEPNKDEIFDIINLAIEAEKNAQSKYREIARMFEDTEAKAIFNNLAEEERNHQRILEDQFYHMTNKGTIIWG